MEEAQTTTTDRSKTVADTHEALDAFIAKMTKLELLTIEEQKDIDSTSLLEKFVRTNNKLTTLVNDLLDKNYELQTEVDAFKNMWAKFKSVEANDEKGMIKATYEASAGIMGLIGRHCQVVLDEFNALNYVQLSFDDPELNKSFIVIVARSEEQTPHELREKALERVKELETKLAQYSEAV